MEEGGEELERRGRRAEQSLRGRRTEAPRPGALAAARLAATALAATLLPAVQHGTLQAPGRRDEEEEALEGEEEEEYEVGRDGSRGVAAAVPEASPPGVGVGGGGGGDGGGVGAVRPCEARIGGGGQGGEERGD